MWGAIAQAGSNMFTSAVNYALQTNTNALNYKMAKENRDWQEKMANTAVQRRADDLQAAGFNRLLAAGGEGASTPSGSVAHATAPQITPLDILGIQQARANIAKTRAETAVADALKNNYVQQNKNLGLQNSILESNDVVRGTEAIKAEQDRKVVDSWFGRNILAPLRVAFGDTGTSVGSVSSMRGKSKH